jgi:hypothetical protein
MGERRDVGGPDPDALPDQGGPDAMRPADPSGRGRPLVGGEDVAGERVRPDERRAASRARRRKAGAKANPSARKRSALGPTGRQRARVGALAKGKGRTAAASAIGRKRGARSKAKPSKGSPKASRRVKARGKSPTRTRSRQSW